MREDENTSGCGRRATKRLALDAAWDAMDEKSVDVVDRKQVKLPDFVGIAMHASTVEAMFELGEVVQLKLGELTTALISQTIIKQRPSCVFSETRATKRPKI